MHTQPLHNNTRTKKSVILNNKTGYTHMYSGNPRDLYSELAARCGLIIQCIFNREVLSGTQSVSVQVQDITD